ncbi:hypothetical protein Rsub_12601 [Raphidocelis subcapitata]|nr:hypothetical protein Rsub_12601 [Raphidocelis subcapitata]|eukprot:GBF98955.1 hypothetical protein Rsub_12601 [Raphidocelis subcapitata]
MTDAFAAVGGGATTKGYFMDGGALIANPFGQTLVGPIYSGCTHCYPECPSSVRDNSIEWARDEGCPDLDGLGPNERCGFLPVTGITRPTANADDEEFIMWAVANRDEAIAAKKVSVNVGTDLIPQKMFKVTWNNRQGSHITEVDGKVSGSKPIYVDSKWRSKALKADKMHYGLNADGL